MIEPQLLAGISDLRLISRKVADSFAAGIHFSHAVDPGLEFSEYRSYQAGDDPRLVDWKMFARSDRYYIRQTESERSATVWLIVDASASMGHRDGTITKMDYARWLAASLGYLAVRQGDGIGLDVMSTEAEMLLPPRRDAQHLQRCLYALHGASPAGLWPRDPRTVVRAASTRRSLSVVITDLYEKEAEISRYTDGLRAADHEVIVFHLMGRNELDFGYRGVCRFEDLESGRSIELDASAAREPYLAALEGWLGEQTRRFDDDGVSYQMFCLDQPVELALRSYLIRRMSAPWLN